MTKLERTKLSKSHNMSKDDAMAWLASLEQPSPEELLDAITAKQYGATGSTYASPTSQIRLSGTPEFIETFAGLLRPLLTAESRTTRLDLRIQRITDRDTKALTDDYALNLHVVERGPGRQPRTLDAIPDDVADLYRAD